MGLRDLLRMLFGGSRPVPPLPPPVVPLPPPPPPTPELERARTIRTLLDLHNKTRAAYDLPELTISAELGRAAERHVLWMADTRTLSHTGYGGSTVGSRASHEGYYWRGVGENIAAGQVTAEEVMKAWMNSPGHRSNILGNYKHIGLAFAKDRSGRMFWCVVLARPAVTNKFLVEEIEVNVHEGIWAPTEG